MFKVIGLRKLGKRTKYLIESCPDLETAQEVKSKLQAKHLKFEFGITQYYKDGSCRKITGDNINERFRSSYTDCPTE